MSRRFLLFGMLLPALAAACGPTGRSPLGRVTGTVTLNGEPLERGRIVFHNPNGRSANARIEDGEIKDVITYDKLNDGVPIGTLTVTIHPVLDREVDPFSRAPAQPPDGSTKPPFPLRYSDPERSELEVEIGPGNNTLTIELTDEG